MLIIISTIGGICESDRRFCDSVKELKDNSFYSHQFKEISEKKIVLFLLRLYIFLFRMKQFFQKAKTHIY